MDADKTQVGGSHYKRDNPAAEHWNLAVYHQWDYFQAQIIKYLMRWKDKGGVTDLEKAAHFLRKYIEVHEAYTDSSAAPPLDAYTKVARAINRSLRDRIDERDPDSV